MAKTSREKTGWPTGWTERAPQISDAERIAEMLNARSQRLYGEDQSSAEIIRSRWEDPLRPPETDMRLLLDDQGNVAAVASATTDGAPYAIVNCSVSVHPLYEAQEEVWDRLLAWSLRRSAELVSLAAPDTRVAAMTFAPREDAARCAAVERAGFEIVRVSNHMGIDLAAATPAPQWPSGVSVRAADVDPDIEAIVRVYLEAWRDHWGFVDRPFDETLAEWRAGAERLGDRLDPTLWFLAVEGSEVVGMALCDDRIADDRTRGYVDSFGVRPAWRKHGVGLALLRHAFAEFRRRGYQVVELDMDSQNLTGALRLYESAGMRVLRQSLHCEKVLRSGVDLATRELSPR